MNWYKNSQQTVPPIQIISYFNNGELGISFKGGQKYTYYNISPYIYNRIDYLLKKKNYSTVSKILRNFAQKNQEETIVPIEKKPQPVSKQLQLPF